MNKNYFINEMNDIIKYANILCIIGDLYLLMEET